MQNFQAKDNKGPARDDTVVLVNMRKKSLDLHARLEELRDLIAQLRDGVGPERNEAWYSFLNKFDTISKATATLTEELDRSMTIGHDNFVATPAALTPDPAELPDFLRTKLDPEVERDFDSLTIMYSSQHTSTSTDVAPSGIVSSGTTVRTGSVSASVSTSAGPGISPSPPSGPSSAVASNAPQGTLAPTSETNTRIQHFNDMIEEVLEEFDERRATLATPRPTDPPAAPASSAAESVIAALISGQGLGPYGS